MQTKSWFHFEGRLSARRQVLLVFLGIITLYGPTAKAQVSPDLSVSVSGRHQRVEGFPAETAVFVQLGVAPTSSSQGSATEPAFEMLQVQGDAEQDTVPYSDVPLDPLERDEVTIPLPNGSGKRRSRDEKNQEEVEISRDSFVLLPRFVGQAIEAAWQAQGISSALSRLESLSSRARTSSLLPEVRFRAGRSVDQSLRLAPTVDDPYRYTQTGGVSFVLEGAATFRLSRLIFANEELGIERLKLAQSRERQRLQETLLEELLVWQKAWLAIAHGGPQAHRAQVRLLESRLRLDVLTGGWFSEHEPVIGKPTNSRSELGASEDGKTKEFQSQEGPSEELMPRKRPAKSTESLKRRATQAQVFEVGDSPETHDSLLVVDATSR